MTCNDWRMGGRSESTHLQSGKMEEVHDKNASEKSIPGLN